MIQESLESPVRRRDGTAGHQSAMIQESLARLPEIDRPANPFPGLRPFEFAESHLFFGREDQIERLIEKLSQTNFLAVVGTSGSGKSSLVRAGLLPALISGRMNRQSAIWRVALMRPGNDPIGNLAHSLNSRDAFSSEEDKKNRDLLIAFTEATLRRGNLGLVEAVRQTNRPARENLVVVVDQFEELFRVGQNTKPEDSENDKAAFVKLLLAASRSEANIYVVLTMRSDYLGDCAQFWDLPEAINEGQYLIPRMTLNQRRAAITGPIAVGGAEITAGIVNRLINDVGDNPDQLPILQHALMRTWDEWKATARPEEPIDLRHYEATGGMAEALSRHADEAYNELPDDALRKVAEKTFKALTEKGEDNREIRNPMLLGEICKVVNAQESDVITVIRAFRGQGRSFLMPPSGTPLTVGSLIDISHESLIRVWKRLKEWVEAEAQSARQYQRLADRAILYAKGAEELLRDPGLQLALNWREQNQPNTDWARRYHADLSAASTDSDAAPKQVEPEKIFDRTMRFLDDSERQRTKSRIKRRLGIAALILLTVAAVVAALFAFQQKKIAEQKTNEAVMQARTVRQLRYVSDINLAQTAFDDNNLKLGQDLLKNYLPDPDDAKDDLRNFAWYYLWRSPHHESTPFSEHTDRVLSVAFSPDGKVLASGSYDKTIKLWNISTGKVLNTLEGHIDRITSVAFSPDGKMLASGSRDKTIKLWDVSTGKLLNTLEGHIDQVNSVVFSPDGKVLASGGDYIIMLWDISTGKPLNTFEGHAYSVSSVAFSMDGKVLASGSWDKTIKLWDVSTGKVLNTLEGHIDRITSVAFSPDGKMLASGSWDKTIKLWDMSTGKQLSPLEGHTESILSVAFSPDGKMLASGSWDNTVQLWDVNTRKLLNTLQGHTYPVSSVAFSMDGKVLASGSYDKTIRLFFAATDEEVAAQRSK